MHYLSINSTSGDIDISLATALVAVSTIIVLVVLTINERTSSQPWELLPRIIKHKRKRGLCS